MNFAVMHDMRLIHTDLKPENVLFVSSEYVKVPDYKVYLLLCTFLSFCFCSFLKEDVMQANFNLLQVTSRSPKEGTYYKRLPKSSAIKVIDFGSTAYEHQDHNYIVSTRHYRAPEVILGMLLF
jgi:dual-specificity kinase